MAKLTPIIDSFAAGELTPRMHLRFNLEVYRNGVGYLENWLTLSQGPAVTRPAFFYKATVPGNYSRPIEFKAFSPDTYVLVVSDDGKIYVYGTGGSTIDPANNLTTNGSFADGDSGWTTDDTGTGTVVFSNSTCVMTGGDQGVWLGQQIQTTNTGVPYIIYVETVGIAPFKISVGTAFKDGTFLAATDSAPVQGQTFSFTPNQATAWISIQCEAGNTVTLNAVTAYESSQQQQLEFNHPWNDDGIRALQVAQPPGEASMYFVSGNQPVQKLTYDRGSDIWAFGPVTFTNPPAEWSGSNQPRAIAFFQNRLWLGGTLNQPETFWGSKSNEFEDFTIPASNPVADDALEVQLNERGAIVWMAGVRNLIIGTDIGEHVATSEGGVLKTGDIQVDQQSAYGSARQSIERVGNRVVYVSPDGRKVREVGYQWTEEAWTSQDLTFFSEHITERIRVTESAWMPNPENQLWNVGNDGRIVACTFDRPNNLVGWHRHSTDGEVLGITGRRYFGFDQIWITVRRTINGTPVTYVEAIEEISDEDFDAIRADSVVAVQSEQVSPGPPITITVPHLAGMTVKVTIDSAVHPDVTLDSSGVGTIEIEGGYNNQRIFVGLAFDSVLRTLPSDYQFATGGTKGALKRYNKIWVSLLTSIKPLINGKRTGERSPQTPMNTREPVRTEYMRVANLGYDRDGIIEITIDDPLPCVVNGLFGELGVNQL